MLRFPGPFRTENPRVGGSIPPLATIQCDDSQNGFSSGRTCVCRKLCFAPVKAASTEGDKTQSFNTRTPRPGSLAELTPSWTSPRSRRWFPNSAPPLGFFDGPSADTDVTETQSKFLMLGCSQLQV